MTGSFDPENVREPFYVTEMEYGDKTILVPEVNIVLFGTVKALNWGNTRLREFPDTRFDHVEFEHDGAMVGTEADEDMMEGFHHHLFPVLFMPYVDQQTQEWWFNHQMAMMSEELGLQ